MRILIGANRVPPSSTGRVLQFITLPLFLPIVFTYYVAARIHLEIMVLDVKLGFATPEQGLNVVRKTFPEKYDYWETRFRVKKRYSKVIRQARQYYEGETVVNDIPVAAEETESEVSNAEILEEMCKMQSGVMITRLAQDKGLSQAEINILRYKANPFRSGAFRVTETTNEDEINKWLKHPMVNHPWPDSFVMSMAAQTPIPVDMMERILRALLQQDYEMWREKAKARVRSKKSIF